MNTDEWLTAKEPDDMPLAYVHSGGEATEVRVIALSPGIVWVAEKYKNASGRAAHEMWFARSYACDRVFGTPEEAAAEGLDYLRDQLSKLSEKFAAASKAMSQIAASKAKKK